MPILIALYWTVKNKCTSTLHSLCITLFYKGSLKRVRKSLNPYKIEMRAWSGQLITGLILPWSFLAKLISEASLLLITTVKSDPKRVWICGLDSICTDLQKINRGWRSSRGSSVENEIREGSTVGMRLVDLVDSLRTLRFCILYRLFVLRIRCKWTALSDNCQWHNKLVIVQLHSGRPYTLEMSSGKLCVEGKSPGINCGWYRWLKELRKGSGPHKTSVAPR